MRILPLILGSALLLGCKAAETPVEAETRPIVPAQAETVQTPTPPMPTLPETRLEDVDFSTYSTELAEVVGLKIGETRLASTDKIRLYFSPEPGTRFITSSSNTFERDDGAVFLFARTGIPDDSVKAQEVYAIFSGSGGADKFKQTLAAYGMRIKCHRGENTTEWQTELCP